METKLYKITKNGESINLPLTQREYNLISLLVNKKFIEVGIIPSTVPYADLDDTEYCQTKYTFKKI